MIPKTKDNMAQRGLLNSYVVVTLGCCGWVPNSSWNNHWRLNVRLQSSLLNCSRRRMFESKTNIMHFGWRLGARLVRLLVGITHWRSILHNCLFPTDQSSRKMEEKLRPWKVPTSVWAVGAPYPPFGHTGRKLALTVGARFFIKIQDFLNCGKTREHVRQGFPNFILHIFNCASIIHSIFNNSDFLFHEGTIQIVLNKEFDKYNAQIFLIHYHLAE